MTDKKREADFGPANWPIGAGADLTLQPPLSILATSPPLVVSKFMADWPMSVSNAVSTVGIDQELGAMFHS